MNLTKTDIAFIAIVILLSSFLMKLFIDNVNSVTIRSNIKSAATIIFKKNRAHRQYSDSLKWEKLRNESPVYDGDTIRTGNQSEASLHFEDKSKLDLADNTLIRIKTSLKDNILDFFGGTLSFKSVKTNKNSFTINTKDGAVINFKENSEASLIQDGDSLLIGVDSGTATLEKNGVTQDIDRTNEVIIDTKSGDVSIVKRSVYPVLPSPDSRHLCFDKPGLNMKFICETENISPQTTARLEISKNINFTNTVSVKTAVLDNNKVTARAEINSGVWFWRMKLKNTGTLSENKVIISSVRRFSVYSESSLVSISPGDNQEFSFRKIKPAVAFNWSESKYANAYILEVSDEAGFKSPFIKIRTNYPRIQNSTLDEGTWYWRVTPIYSFLEDIPDIKTRTFSFTVTRKGDIEKPVTYLPPDQSLFEIVNAKNKGLGFSWKPQDEAVLYELAVSKDRNFKKLLITRTTDQTYLKLGQETIAPLLKEDSWYWAVRTKDEEGNFSHWSDPKKLTGVDAVLSQRLIYPPDKYIIADSLTSNIRFSWRSNIPAKKVFQVSSTVDFKEIMYNQEINIDTLIGKRWEIGTWYWRIRTLNTDGTVFLDSKIRSFEIVEPLPAVYLKQPESNETLISVDDSKTTFTWDPIPNADYYMISVSVDKREFPVLQMSLYPDTEFELALNKYENASWTVTIKAGANEKENSTRLLGFLGTSAFSVRALKPVMLTSPENKSVFEGLEVKRNGIQFKWFSEEKITSSTFVISKDKAGEVIVFEKNDPDHTEIIKNLKNGVYYYNVKAMTTVGYDIKAREPVQFTIEEIPLLAMPDLKSPANRTVIDFDYLKTNMGVIFEWDAVENATEYSFTLYRKKPNSIIVQKNGIKETTFKYIELKKLSKGELYWEIMARSLDKEGNIEQDGYVAKSKFTIDIPEITKDKEKKIDGLYGN